MTILLLLVGFLAGLSATGAAATEGVTVTERGIDFEVDRFTDGRSKPYRVVFNNDGLRAVYRFDTDGRVTNIRAGSERYRVLYRSNGDLKRVKSDSSSTRRRQLVAELDNDSNDTVGIDHDGTIMVENRRRRLYECSDCVETWDAVCTVGVPAVCDLLEYGTPISTAAAASIETFCDVFASVCSSLTATDACKGSCAEEECSRSLKITLESFAAADLDLHVTEPNGNLVFQEDDYAVFGDVGFLDHDHTGISGGDQPENYLLYSGLSVDEDDVLGDYTAYVKLFDGDGGEYPWKLTASSNGDVLWEEEGTFIVALGDQNARSATFTATVSEYMDNGCSNTEL